MSLVRYIHAQRSFRFLKGMTLDVSEQGVSETTGHRVDLAGVYMTLARLSPRSEFTPVPSHGSIFVYMIPPQNVMPARVTPAWVHHSCCTGARISLRYEISQRYHVNANRPKEPTTCVGVKSVCGWTGTGSACVMFAILKHTYISLTFSEVIM